MNLLLSWDLFILAIFVIIIAYSFMIGINKTTKTIIGTYLAILAADGLGNILQDYFMGSANFKILMQLTGIANPAEMLITFKVIVFMAAIVILTIKGAYDVKIKTGDSAGTGVLATGLFGFLSAGLIISTVLVYISGSSLIQKVSLQSNIVELYTSSGFVKGMIDFYDFWFAVPVVIIIAWSFIFSNNQS